MKPIHNLIRDTGDLVRLTAPQYKTLVENSKDYDGDDKPRKIISRMITLAEEKLNIPHTQLLAKWDLYLVEINEGLFDDAGKSFSPQVKDWLSDKLDAGVVLSLGYFDEAINDAQGYRSRVEDVVWQEQEIDIDEQNAFGSENTWGEDVVDEITETGKVTLLVHLDETSSVKNTYPLVASAKDSDIKIVNGGQLALYRAYNFADAFGDMAEVNIIIHGTAEFFGNAANKPLLNEIFSWLDVADDSFHAHATAFNKNGYFGGDEVMLNLKFTSDGNHEKKIEVPNLDGEDYRLYFSEDERELDSIKNIVKSLEDTADSKVVPAIDADGKVSGKIPLAQFDNTVGYLSVNGVESIETLPRRGAVNIPIMEDTIRDIIVYFGLSQTLERPQDAGLGLPRVLTGKPGYIKVVANCLPVFMYGPGSNRRDYGVLNEGGDRFRLRNELYIEHPILKDLVVELLPFMDFEASNFYHEMVSLEEEEAKTIKDYIDEDPEFEEGYLKMYDRLASHLRLNYDHFVL